MKNKKKKKGRSAQIVHRIRREKVLGKERAARDRISMTSLDVVAIGTRPDEEVSPYLGRFINTKAPRRREGKKKRKSKLER